MNIRKATKKDIPFIVNAILEIESFGDTNTFNNLFGSNTDETTKYLKAFLSDAENFGNEFSLDTYFIAEVDQEIAACCALFCTDSAYYQSKSELFPIHLKPDHLNIFFENVKRLPDNKKILEHKNYIEYLFVAKRFRNRGISRPLIEKMISKVDRLYILALENNTFAVEYYKKLGFIPETGIESFEIDNPENSIYAGSRKVIIHMDNQGVS